MTQEEINKLKALRDNLMSTGNRAYKGIEETFPEVFESESEKIRKIIKLALIASEEELSAFYSTHNITRKECTDWLEKDKDRPKLGDKDEFAFTLRNCLMADSELTEKQANAFTDAYGEDLYKVAIGELDPGVCEEDIEEYLNEVKSKTEIKSVTIGGLPPVTGNKATDITPWRPTKEQMDKLHAYAYGCPDGRDAKVLYSLLDDLNALCENKPLHWNKNVTDGLTEDKDLLNVLVGLINWSGTPWSGVDKDKFVDFLNKRFMNQPTDEEMIRTLRCEYEKGVADTIAKYEQKTSIFPPGFGEVHFNPILCEQKEQKPAEWSEEDEKNWNEYIGRLKSEYRKTPNVVLWDDINWLEALHKRLKSLRPQPKAEWNEEDEKMLDAIIGDVMTLHNAKSLDELREKVDWLKYHYSHSEKPNNQLSEDDEKDIAHIIRVLDDCYGYGKHDLSKTDHENLVNTLKSLHPHWNPNEEQMEYLNRAANKLHNMGFMWMAGKLRWLRDDLEKNFKIFKYGDAKS